MDTDVLFVISDTHLGGVAGGQIFASTNEMKGFLRHLIADAKKAPAQLFTLLINGDFVDFLAEPQPVYFDPLGACDRLDRILLHEPNFAGILKGLRDFLKQPNCRLIVNLGNHDLELGLPWVEEHFVDMLSDGDPDARARVRVLTDGTGCLVNINGFQIYCAHGNEVDPWNATDHEHIRRIAREFMRGRDPEAWIPNAGTQMVIDVMNDIKRDYPFVDILKPETGAVVPILSALRPSLAGKLAGLVGILRRQVWDGARLRTGFLSGEDQPGQEPAQPVTRSALPPLSRDIQSRMEKAAGDCLSDANARYLDKLRPVDLIAAGQSSDQLGVLSRLTAQVLGRSLSDQVRRELRPLATDRSFDLLAHDETFETFDTLVGPRVHVVVTGHSHLRRAHPRNAGRGYYYNTGTWARVVQITEAMLDDQARFDTFFTAVEKGTLDALDALNGVVQRFNPVFTARSDGKKVRLSLNSVTGKARGAGTVVAPVAGTEFELG